VFIRVEVGWLCREQHGRRPVEFNTRSFVAGGPEPQEGGGLGHPRSLILASIESTCATSTGRQ